MIGMKKNFWVTVFFMSLAMGIQAWGQVGGHLCMRLEVGVGWLGVDEFVEFEPAELFFVKECD